MHGAAGTPRQRERLPGGDVAGAEARPVAGRSGRAVAPGVHTHTFGGASGVLPISANPSPCAQSAEMDTHG